MCLRARLGGESREDNTLIAWVRADHWLTVIEGIPCRPSYRSLTLSAAGSHLLVAVEKSLDFLATSGIIQLLQGDADAARHSPPTLTHSEQKAILRATARHPRDHLIYSLSLRTGLRLAEIVGLGVVDVYIDDRTPRTRLRIRPKIAKGGRTGDVFLPDALWWVNSGNSGSTRRDVGRDCSQAIPSSAPSPASASASAASSSPSLKRFTLSSTIGLHVRYPSLSVSYTARVRVSVHLVKCSDSGTFEIGIGWGPRYPWF